MPITIDELYEDIVDDSPIQQSTPFIEGQDDDDIDYSATIINPYDTHDDFDQVSKPITNDAIRDLLLAKGIQDPNSINYENDNGQIEQVNFYDLPYEDQLSILQSTDKDIDYDLDDHEIQVLNFLRENKVTFEDAIEYYKRQAVEEYLKENDTTDFTVDSYTDEELFLLDLKTKYDTLTEEELKFELEKETAHSELFKKKIDKIRAEYKELEIRQHEAEERQLLTEEEERFDELKGNLIEVATATKEIGGLDLDDTERNQILTYILQKDVNGNSSLIKDLDNPNTLFNIAWYAVKGPEAFQFVHDYYHKEIDKVRKSAYDKGKQDALNGSRSTPINKVTDNSRSRINSIANKKVTHMDDLYDLS